MRAGLRDGCRAQIGREHLRTRMRPGMFCTTRSDRIGAKSKAERARRRSTRSVSRPGWTQAAVASSRDTTRNGVPMIRCRCRRASHAADASSPSWALERRPLLEAFLGIRASRRRLLSQPERTAQDLAVAHDEVIAQNRLRQGRLHHWARHVVPAHLKDRAYEALDAEPRGLNCGPKLRPLRDRPRPADHTTDVFADRETESERRGLSRTSTPATPRYAQPISHRKVANAPDSLKSQKRRPKRAPAFHPPRELLGALPRRCPRRCLPSVPLGRSVLVDVGLRRR